MFKIRRQMNPENPVRMLRAIGLAEACSFLILVGVAMDTVSQIEAQLVMRNYEGFLGSGGRLRGRRA